MKFIILECDKYIDFIEAKKYSYDTHCREKLDVIVLGYTPPKCDIGNWQFVSLGRDTGAKNFSNDLLKFFRDFEDEFFVFDNTDLLALDRVDYEMLDIYRDLLVKHNAGRACISSAIEFHKRDLYRMLSKGHDYDVYEHRPGADYKLALHASVWRTSYFLRYLKPDMDPWQMDTNREALEDGVRVLGTTRRYFMDASHIFKRGKLLKTWNRSTYTNREMSKTDQNHIYDIIRRLKLA